jgi:hypothetical protein
VGQQSDEAQNQSVSEIGQNPDRAVLCYPNFRNPIITWTTAEASPSGLAAANNSRLPTAPPTDEVAHGADRRNVSKRKAFTEDVT